MTTSQVTAAYDRAAAASEAILAKDNDTQAHDARIAALQLYFFGPGAVTPPAVHEASIDIRWAMSMGQPDGASIAPVDHTAAVRAFMRKLGLI